MSESFLRYLRHFLKETEETRDKAKDYLKESTFFCQGHMDRTKLDF